MYGARSLHSRKRRKRLLVAFGCGSTLLLFLIVFWLSGGSPPDREGEFLPDDNTPKPPHQGAPSPTPPVAVVPKPDDWYSVKLPNVLPSHDEKEDPEIRKKRDAVKAAFVHAYSGYENLCMGKGELHPISGKCNNWLVANMGLTIMDSLDTMLLMGLDDFYQRGRDFLSKNLNWNQTINVSVFETNIRCLGGLLSAYALTKDPLMLQKSIELADHLLPAFDTPTGYPFTWINLLTKEKTLSSWTSGSVILSELGTMQMEFVYLSTVSGDPKYGETAMKAFETLMKNKPASTLYPLLMDPISGAYTTDLVGIGALGDSFYEYVLKVWLLKDSQDVLGKWYFDLAEAIIDQLGTWIDDSIFFISERHFGRKTGKMDHLACFAGAMFALGAQHTQNNVLKLKHMKHAKGVGAACKKMYELSSNGLPCEIITMQEGKNEILPSDERAYQMRPEAVETWFYLYRLTNDTKYQEWGWEFFQAIEKYTRTTLGYTGIRDVTAYVLEPDDKQQSFFLAETLKYLYLLFSPHDVLPLDKFVFNTEAHPFPLKVNK